MIKKIEDNINLRNATVAYASALDVVEECLRNKTEPFVSNKHLSQIRLYKDPINFNFLFSIKGLFILCILGFIGTYYLGDFLSLTILQASFIVFSAITLMLMGFFTHTFPFLIYKIGGMQKKKSAKILNELLRKNL